MHAHYENELKKQQRQHEQEMREAAEEIRALRRILSELTQDTLKEVADVKKDAYREADRLLSEIEKLSKTVNALDSRQKKSTRRRKSLRNRRARTIDSRGFSGRMRRIQAFLRHRINTIRARRRGLPTTGTKRAITQAHSPDTRITEGRGTPTWMRS